MNTLTPHTTAAMTNGFLSLPSLSSIDKRTGAPKSYAAVSFLSKNASRKTSAKLFSIDWDLNRNELEFE